jgi:hypothetical protein
MHVELPPDLLPLLDDLEGVAGVRAVVLGGSRALGTADEGSDWDLGVYYQGPLDLRALTRWGQFHPPGSWGRIMNGGAWLTLGRLRVDVILRDLDVVERWSDCTRRGEFEIDSLLGYLAGVPTYSLLAERSVARILRGSLSEVGPFPARLAEVAPERWRFCRRFTIEHARSRAKRGDLVGTVGQTAKAVIEEAHACLSEQHRWVLNEKRIVAHAGLDIVDRAFASAPPEAGLLIGWVERVATLLESHSHAAPREISATAVPRPST